jgi:hypothetical protein
MPVTRPSGRAIVVGSPACRAQALATMHRHGFACVEYEDPYSTMLELATRPLVYQAVVLSLNSLFREELALIAAVKRFAPRIEIWLTHTDGRLAALAEAMRFGADGLLAEDGLHRTAIGAPQPAAVASPAPAVTLELPQQIRKPLKIDPPIHRTIAPPPAPKPVEPAPSPIAQEQPIPAAPEPMRTEPVNLSDPVLTADELRALLHDSPFPGGDE